MRYAVHRRRNGQDLTPPILSRTMFRIVPNEPHELRRPTQRQLMAPHVTFGAVYGDGYSDVGPLSRRSR